MQRLRITHPGDITATAIAGAAAMITFRTSPWTSRDIGAVIRGADTAVAWWRSLAVSEALSSFTDRTFVDWSEDASVRVGGGDPVRDDLLTAALTASFLGDHGTWCHLNCLLERDMLVRLDRHSDSADASAGITELRLSGSEKALTLAVRRLAANGPATAITHAAAKIRLGASTWTTGSADLALLQQGGTCSTPLQPKDLSPGCSRPSATTQPSSPEPTLLSRLAAAHRHAGRRDPRRAARRL